MGNGLIPVAVTPRIKLCWVPRVVERVNVAFDMLIWKTKIFSLKLIDERRSVPKSVKHMQSSCFVHKTNFFGRSLYLVRGTD